MTQLMEESEASVIDGTESSEENSDETLPAEDELPKEMIWYNLGATNFLITT